MIVDKSVDKYWQKGYHVYTMVYHDSKKITKDSIYDTYESGLKAYDRACVRNKDKDCEILFFHRPENAGSRPMNEIMDDFIFVNSKYSEKLQSNIYPKIKYRDVSKDTPISKRELVL